MIVDVQFPHKHHKSPLHKDEQTMSIGLRPGHSRHANEMDEVARAWLLRAELAKSAVENLRVHMDLRANQAKNRNSLVRKINIAPAQG